MHKIAELASISNHFYMNSPLSAFLSPQKKGLKITPKVSSHFFSLFVILYRIPSPFLYFFSSPRKKNLPKSHSTCRANFFLKLNFKNLKVVLEAAEAVEATIMNTQTLKELGIEQKKVPSNIRNEKKSLRFLFHLRQKCVLGRDFAPLGFYYSPRFA